MSLVKHLLDEEIYDTERAISQMERVLEEEYAEDDSQADAQRKLLRAQRAKLRFLQGLADHADDPDRLTRAILGELGEAANQHAEEQRKRPFSDDPLRERWWQTLQAEQWLRSLADQIAEITLR
jgi:hypothetical protein